MNSIPHTLAKILQQLHGVRPQRDGSWLARCPAHDDREPSLHVSLTEDRILLHCFAGCSVDSICRALGITTADLFLRNGHHEPELPEGLTLTQFALVKRLSEEHLRQCGVSQTEWQARPAVAFAYVDVDGNQQAVRYRTALTGNRFRWHNGAKPKSLLYGAWWLPLWREKGVTRVLLVEGESDCLTLWQAGIPAVGVAGADCLSEENASLLDGLQVVLWKEPDAGGQKLLESAIPLFGDRLRVIDPPEGVKDANDLWVQTCNAEPDLHKATAWFKQQIEVLVDSAISFLPLIRNGVSEEINEGANPALKSFLPLIRNGVSEETKTGVKHTSGGVLYARGADMLAMGNHGVEWLWHGLLARGEITLLSGREKAGKSTFTFALLRALLKGETFLMRQVKQSRVLLVEESPKSVVDEAIERFDLHDALVILKSNIPPSKMALPPLCAEMAEIVKGERVDLIVIDTFTAFSGLRGEQENHAGAVQQALEPIRRLSDALQVGVLLLHHLNKGGEEYRGSTALGGFVDTLITFKRAEGNRPRHRVLEAIGRHTEETSLLVCLEEDGTTYVLEDPQESVLRSAIDAVKKALSETAEPLSQSDLVEATGLPRQRVSEALQRLVSVGEVTQSGTGKRNDPYRYAPVFISSETTPLITGRNEMRAVATLWQYEQEVTADDTT